jgi:hypothetical protein
MPDRWRYPPDLLDALAVLGFAPREDTPPLIVRDAVSELYKFELRRLRDAYRRGGQPKGALAEQVIRLRKRYWVLTLPPGAWERI